MTQPTNIVRIGDKSSALPGADDVLLQVDRPPTLVVGAASRIAGPDTAAALTNVIAFAPWRRLRTVDEMADDLVAGDDDRSATLVGKNDHRTGIIALMLASCLVHAGMLAFLNRDPQPLANAETAAISVEFVQEVGGASVPARQTAEAPSAVHDAAPETMAAAEDSIVPSAENRPSPAPETSAVNRQAAAAARDASPQVEPVTKQDADVPALPPPPAQETSEPTPAHPAAVATTRRDAGMPERSSEPVEQALRSTKPGPRPAAPDHVRPAARPTRTLTGLAARESATATYLAAVASHLGRFWQLPADVLRPGERRNATVRFIIDGTGRATGVALLQATGVTSLDAESLAMVRRASPFSRPPGGHAMSVSVPLTFSLP